MRSREGLFVSQSNAESARDQISGSKLPSQHHMPSLLYFGWKPSEVLCHQEPQEQGLSPDSAIHYMTTWDGDPFQRRNSFSQPPAAPGYCTSTLHQKNITLIPDTSEVLGKKVDMVRMTPVNALPGFQPPQLEKQRTTTGVKMPFRDSFCKVKFNCTLL